ncbi:hypothetical protein [Agriterribacter humi]|uniref:hypothetical protein n=1 Tax=Agriterribacter humi TaxID=1104781 RepID=UPI001263FF64|nr:hypothetical protein [Agriterribacter humi]
MSSLYPFCKPQKNPALTAREATYLTGSTGLKQVKYEYDLVSGKVNKVLYSDGKWDQFYYQYLYIADNRVTEALSSRTNEREPALWVTETTYHYYLHGPLARVELGKNNVEGMDYAYTLQGVNGHFLDVRDMSGDGLSESPFQNHARDSLACSNGKAGRTIEAWEKLRRIVTVQVCDARPNGFVRPGK